MIAVLILASGLLLLGVFDQGRSQTRGTSRLEPQYTKEGQLIRPENYRTWIFAGSDLGIRYSAEAAARKQDNQEKTSGAGAGVDSAEVVHDFHNIYINPEAYEHYSRTGKFPEKTMFALDIYEAKKREPQGIVDQGYYEAAPIGFLMAVKNSARPDGSKTPWAYYIFQFNSSPLKKSAAAQPDASCFKCHLEHGNDDNVWVQFYPTLRLIQEKFR